MTEGGCGTGPREALSKFQGAQREPDKHTQRKHRVWFPSRQLGKNYRHYWATSTRPAQHRLPDKITPIHTEKGELPHQPALPHTNSRSCSSPAARPGAREPTLPYGKSSEAQRCGQPSFRHAQPAWFFCTAFLFPSANCLGFFGGNPTVSNENSLQARSVASSQRAAALLVTTSLRSHTTLGIRKKMKSQVYWALPTRQEVTARTQTWVKHFTSKSGK